MSTQHNHHWQLARATVLPSGQTSRRQFFFSQNLLRSAKYAYPVYAPVEKLGVLLEGAASALSTVVRLDDGRLRLYYTCANWDGKEEMQIAVAESIDGLKWKKIPLGQKTVAGYDTNRLHFSGLTGAQDIVGQPQVLRLANGNWRMYFWKHGDGCCRYTVAESADGLQWHVPDIDKPTLYHPNDKLIKVDWTSGLTTADLDGAAEGDRKSQALAKTLLTNDATYVYYNEHLNRFECYTVWLTKIIPERIETDDNAPGVVRLIQRRISADGLLWSAPELIIQPDPRDPWDQQFYHLAVQWHEDWLIGSLGHFRVESGQQTMDLELAFSRDGRSWERPMRGGFIPRDPSGRDSKGIYPPNAWIDLGDRWLCLYTGEARCHNEFGPEFAHLPHSCIMGATFAKNRILGLAVGRVSGGFLSEPFFPQQDCITVDADIRGWLRAELCDVWGRKLPGHHLMDADVIRGDNANQSLTWRGKNGREFLDSRVDNCVRLRFEYQDGIMYNIGF